MYLTETIAPLALVSEMLCGDEVAEEATARFAGYQHNKDLCPGFRKRILRILSTYEKHRIDVHDVQGFQDEGVDVSIRFDADDGTTKLGLQIKSFDEIKKWKDKKDPGFLIRAWMSRTSRSRAASRVANGTCSTVMPSNSWAKARSISII